MPIKYRDIDDVARIEGTGSLYDGMPLKAAAMRYLITKDGELGRLLTDAEFTDAQIERHFYALRLRLDNARRDAIIRHFLYKQMEEDNLLGGVLALNQMKGMVTNGKWRIKSHMRHYPILEYLKDKSKGSAGWDRYSTRFEWAIAGISAPANALLSAELWTEIAVDLAGYIDLTGAGVEGDYDNLVQWTQIGTPQSKARYNSPVPIEIALAMQFNDYNAYAAEYEAMRISHEIANSITEAVLDRDIAPEDILRVAIKETPYLHPIPCDDFGSDARAIGAKMRLCIITAAKD